MGKRKNNFYVRYSAIIYKSQFKYNCANNPLVARREKQQTKKTDARFFIYAVESLIRQLSNQLIEALLAVLWYCLATHGWFLICKRLFPLRFPSQQRSRDVYLSYLLRYRTCHEFRKIFNLFFKKYIQKKILHYSKSDEWIFFLTYF